MFVRRHIVVDNYSHQLAISDQYTAHGYTAGTDKSTASCYILLRSSSKYILCYKLCAICGGIAAASTHSHMLSLPHALAYQHISDSSFCIRLNMAHVALHNIKAILISQILYSI